MTNSSLVMTIQASLRGKPSLLHLTALSVAGASWLLRVEVSASCTRMLWASWVVVLQKENIGKLYSDGLISPQLNPPLGFFEEISQIFWCFSLFYFSVHPSKCFLEICELFTHWMGYYVQRSNFLCCFPQCCDWGHLQHQKGQWITLLWSFFNADFAFTVTVLYSTIKQWHPSPMVLRALTILYDPVLLAINRKKFWLPGCLSAWIACLFKTTVDWLQTSEEDLEISGP